MRALVQRVTWAEVEVAGVIVGRIKNGLLVYLGVGKSDRTQEAERLAEKIAGLRIFQDDADKLNRSVRDVRGGVLAIPNFTLLADARKGRRPAFTDAAPGEAARSLYEAFVDALLRCGCPAKCGNFGAYMMIRSEAAGPVNIVIDVPDTDGPGQARNSESGEM